MNTIPDNVIVGYVNSALLILLIYIEGDFPFSENLFAIDDARSLSMPIFHFVRQHRAADDRHPKEVAPKARTEMSLNKLFRCLKSPP